MRDHGLYSLTVSAAQAVVVGAGVYGKPCLGTVERLPGLFVATSHSGITLAPVHGKVISELIVHGRTDVPIESYRPERHMPAV